MRIQELLSEGLMDILRVATDPSQEKKPADINATQKPITSVGTSGSQTPSQASAQQNPQGGTTTPANGTPTTPQTGQQNTQFKPDLGKLQAMRGKQLDVPGLGKVTIGNTTPQGIEVDTSKDPNIGAQKIIIPLK
jgi:hypothetical protein